MSTLPTDGLPTPRRHRAAIAIWLAMSMAVLDGAIVNVALPVMARELQASPAQSIWVLNAYQIAITMLLLPIAAAGEWLGYRRVYIGGLATFGIASLACTLAMDLPTLAVARFAQGFGAAAIMAINGALVRHTYPMARLGRGIAVNSLIVAIASAAGPSIAAAILAVGSWRWLFAVNLPVGLLALLIGRRSLPEAGGSGGRLDFLAALLNVVMFGAAFLAATDAAHERFGIGTLVELGVCVLAAVLLVRRGRGQQSPLIPLDLLRVPILRLSYLTSIGAFSAQIVALIALPFTLQARGYDQVHVGLLITAWPLAIAVAAPLAGKLGDRLSGGLLGGIGLGVMSLGLAGLAALADRGSLPWLVLSMAACGAGFGFFQTPNNRIMLGTAPPGRSGAASGMLAVARLTGQTAGAVLVALLFRLGGAETTATYVIAAAIAGAAALISLRRVASR